ncbi:MAG TPA: RNA polymerase subunit sigma-70 [Hyphomonadaceae bacterium]|nr:RNA polymerase subunit sigma-70 [Ponticaulis sp.]RPG16829.1 MAG: sigma-70 family RNA polymerase sigma factor [Hyphomonadaceae bacterium TMED125]HBH90215.1 RNA polymerase subunit sigma-70 [Hyphomonadaceae bacterium]HBJ93011.1 RNA polymerase subunit sigma-70 [Hyphomonadaceae bacterium]
MSIIVDDNNFKRELSELIPHLRAFARNLCSDATQADDLAQETLMRAWKARESYQEGTNLKAWCFTILRNTFYSEKRRSWRRQPLDPEVAEATLVSNDNPADSMELLALRNALNELPDDQREALILVGAGGLPYEEVAEICGCAVGTIKSRVNRARTALAVIMESNSVGFNSDSSMSASEAFDDLIAQADSLSGSTPA